MSYKTTNNMNNNNDSQSAVTSGGRAMQIDDSGNNITGCNYVDSHAHYYDKAFSSDRSDVLDRIKQSGVKAIIVSLSFNLIIFHSFVTVIK